MKPIRDQRKFYFITGWIFIFSLFSFSFPAASQEKEKWKIVPTESLFVIKGSPTLSLRQPTDIAVGAKGQIYVMDGLNGRVAVFTSQGAYRFSFGSDGSGPGQMRFPVGIGISSSGKIYVADSGNHRIQVFTPQGKFIRSFPLKTGDKADPTDVLPSQFKNFCYVVDNDNHNVQVYDATTGRYLKSWGSHGKNLGEFRYPATIAADDYNRIYVVDVMNARVQAFDPFGDEAREVASWGVKPGKVFRPKGVTIDKTGKIYISDSYTEIIQIFRERGDLFGILGDRLGNIRKFTTPTNILLDRQDRLFVVETRANQITVFRILP